MRHDTAAVRALVRQGDDVNAAQGDGMTALHWAATHGDAELAEVLLYAGANVRATSRLGRYTPLHVASETGAAAVVRVLLARGADATAATSTGATALMLAAQLRAGRGGDRAARRAGRRQRGGDDARPDRR